MKQNLSAKYSYRIRRAQREADKFYNQPAMLAVDAFLGDNNGLITTYQGAELQPGYVVVRDMSGNLSIAYNQRVPLTPGLAIKVGYDPIQPVLFQVLSIRDYLTENPALNVPAHHSTHEFPSNDTVFVGSFQLLPGLIYTGTGFIVTLYPFFFKKSDGTRGFLQAQTLDLESYVPATGAQAFTICVDDNNDVVIVPGNTSGSIGTLTISDFPTITNPEYHEIWGVRLYNGQSGVYYTDCYDFRFGGVSGGGSGSGILIMNPDGVVMPTEPRLQFTGNQVSVTDDPTGTRTIVNIADPDIPIVLPATARWSASAGDDVFDFPDIVHEIQSVQVNGLGQDPLTYSLTGASNQLTLDDALPFDAVVTANYTIEAL